jgi:poly(A) polymerase
VVNGRNFEITTLRKDNETDGRHCDPEFVDDFALDAARRDFTINALFLDAEGLVYDYFDGISDLKNQKVKFIGDANQRIKEDYLRILRFFRFSCRYAQELEGEGLMACTSQRENLQKLSKERIRAEFLKMLSCERQENLIAILEVFKDKKIADEIFKESLNVKALERLFEIEKKFKIISSLNLKLAVLFLGKDFDLKIFTKEISATNLEKKYFQFLILNRLKPEIDYLKQLLTEFDKELVTDLYLFFLAKENALKEISEVKKTIIFLQKFSLPDFPLSGEELMQLGFKGKKLGDAIIRAKKFWSENDFNLSKKALIKFLQDYR